MNIPNLITISRICLVPLVIWLIIAERPQAACVAFAAAGLSDALDGFLAKRYGWQTELGAYLDPLADKALLVSIYLSLGYFAHLPAWLVIAVVSRDLLIIGAMMLSWMLDRPMAVRPSQVSKANTVGQIVLAGLVLADMGFALGWASFIMPITWLVGVLTVWSAAAYLVGWLGHMAASGGPAVQPRVTNAKKSTVNLRRAEKPAAGS